MSNRNNKHKLKMEKLFLLGAMVCAFGMMTACSSDTEYDYAEIIIGKWLPEYAYIEQFNDKGDCIGTERWGAQGDIYDRYVMEFSSDGKINSYKYGEEPSSDNQNRIYRVEGKKLYIYNSLDVDHPSILNILVLNDKSLDLSSDFNVSDYDSPEPPSNPDVCLERWHTIFNRI